MDERMLRAMVAAGAIKNVNIIASGANYPFRPLYSSSRLLEGHSPPRGNGFSSVLKVR
jgi:hypothetical protein